ncbi:MAG: MucB/RseB C-terminal domain-containing protein [Xanthomonadaceae bacterium]|nr:MucB/RseB C-terminal domain-containing protein [Xanthomonadaceae bacterium]MDE1957898.1 MucB/RseB C-terminal domain-containing protein [Xanthomonadaceae bacterium]MDE2245131.1 MucB/RseB C-terminal domain-containing protein [Xanthomonadaceae bacterium]
MRARRGALLLLLGLPGLAAAAQPLAAAAWQRMRKALVGLDYSGTLVLRQGSDLQTLAIEHRAGSPDRDLLTSLDGRALQITRSGTRVQWTLAGASPLRLDPGRLHTLLPLVPDVPLAALHPSYTLTLQSGERIAARATAQLRIRPRDDYRYGYRLWLDRASGLPLRVQLTLDGRPLPEEFRFVDLRVGARADLAALRGAAPVTATASPGLPAQPALWRVVNAPPGFHVRVCLGDGTPGSEHLVLSDGIASVSVYVQRGPVPLPQGTGVRGALSFVSETHDGERVTVLGDVPVPTVQRIADSVALAAGR